MSWSLELRNGDLALNGTKLGQVTGPQKLVQDLRCALLTKRGSDDLHPEFGYIIDGGIDQYGRPAVSLIAGSDAEYIAMRIQAEIKRISADYQKAQLARAQNDRYTYGRSTLDNGELLLNVSNIQMIQATDTLIVRVALTTGDGRVVNINVPVTDAPLITT